MKRITNTKAAGRASPWNTGRGSRTRQPDGHIIKSVKRAMAGEYSRELFDQVFKGSAG